ncbi:MAG: GNAT family N-acetyltransferase, partial [Pseudomonadales bacterium]|nr:GNAT family N-acetyltransferase [Pseudomonadales bacterium]MDP5059996.1 GNAT family N-acetyltransferase [Pseudomonadales bacterium]
YTDRPAMPLPVDFFEPEPPTSITTTRLSLAQFTANDAELLHAAARASVKEVYPWLPWCHPNYSLTDSKDWIATCGSLWSADSAWAFAIRERQQGQLVGSCGLHRIDEHHNANLGFWIATPATGRGYASEAALALAAYGIRYLQLMRIEIIMSTRNHASEKVAINLGAHHEGIARNRLMLHDQPHHAHVYALTPEDLLLP